jgi:hypothetical protein
VRLTKQEVPSRRSHCAVPEPSYKTRHNSFDLEATHVAIDLVCPSVCPRAANPTDFHPSPANVKWRQVANSQCSSGPSGDRKTPTRFDSALRRAQGVLSIRSTGGASTIFQRCTGRSSSWPSSLPMRNHPSGILENTSRSSGTRQPLSRRVGGPFMCASSTEVHATHESE